MKTMLLALLAAGSLTAPAMAGQNAGGTLVLHAQPSVVYTHDIGSYCSSFALSSCESAVTSVTGSQTYVFFVVAAFPTTSDPALTGLVFGIHYTSTIGIVNAGNCASFELSGSGWPGSDTGTALTWNEPQTAKLTPVYWFAGYNYYAPQQGNLSVRAHPTQGGYFADDSIPAILDPIAGFGRLGFNQTGYLPCPGMPSEPGACCFPDGTCSVLDPSLCFDGGGVFQGSNTTCSPNPCPAPPPTGACCFPHHGCQVLYQSVCENQGGSYSGDHTDCEPNLCPGDPGACCFPDGYCLRETPEFCESSGGTFGGEGLDCSPNPCPAAPIGACCLSDGSCVVESEYHCLLEDGVYKDDGSVCETDPCSLVGACCFSGAVCQQLTELECVGQSGEYLGDNISCEPAACGEPCLPGRPSMRSVESTPLPSPTTWPGNGAIGRRGDSGPNAGGVLLLTTNPTLSYTLDELNYCGASNLESCEQAIVREDRPVFVGLHLFAAFPAESSPRLRGVSFGISYGPCVEMLNWLPCAEFESPNDRWPDSGEGTGIAFAVTQTAHLTELYWFVTYVEPGRPEEVRVIPHPTQGATFGDDSVPAILDPVADLGRFGFNRDGYLPCPELPLATGACCFPSGECTLTTPSECSGLYQGDDTDCDPNPCSVTAVERTTWGRLKSIFH